MRKNLNKDVKRCLKKDIINFVLGNPPVKNEKVGDYYQKFLKQYRGHTLSVDSFGRLLPKKLKRVNRSIALRPGIHEIARRFA